MDLFGNLILAASVDACVAGRGKNVQSPVIAVFCLVCIPDWEGFLYKKRSRICLQAYHASRHAPCALPRGSDHVDDTGCLRAVEMAGLWSERAEGLFRKR